MKATRNFLTLTLTSMCGEIKIRGLVVPTSPMQVMLTCKAISEVAPDGQFSEMDVIDSLGGMDTFIRWSHCIGKQARRVKQGVSEHYSN